MSDNTLLNKKRYQHSNAKIVIGLKRIIGIKSVDFEDELTPGKVRGTSKGVQGRTSGIYNASGSIEIYKDEAQLLRDTLGPGYGEVEFNIIIHYQSPGMALQTVELVGCRITKDSTSHSEDENGLADKLDLDIMRIRRNGIELVGPEV